jgi:hypothetical protein
MLVNKSDSTRVDLILPNEQYLYLRASDYKERQKWLVALASQKATYPMNNLTQMIGQTSGGGGQDGAEAGSANAESKLPNLSKYKL